MVNLKKLPVPIYEGYTIGFRAWQINSDSKNLRLASRFDVTAFGPITNPEPLMQLWPLEEPMTSQCIMVNKQEVHVSPATSCSCGLYAYYSLEDALKSLKPAELNNVVIGSVLTWGKVQLHTEGFRAQYMKPLALLKSLEPQTKNPFPSLDEILQELARGYSIPLVNELALQAIAEEWGIIWNHTSEWQVESLALSQTHELSFFPVKSSMAKIALVGLFPITLLFFSLGMSLLLTGRFWAIPFTLPMLSYFLGAGILFIRYCQNEELLL